MKEIDLLPDWYKRNRRLQIVYCVQYTALGCIVALMMVWNFATGRSLTKVAADVTHLSSKQPAANSAFLKYAYVQGQIAEMKEKVSRLHKVSSRVDIVKLLGELSFLIDEKIILTGLDIKAESFDLPQSRQEGVRPAIRGGNQRRGTLVGDVKFRISISGITADSSNVGELICKLEDSPYFCRVIPSFSRTTEQRKIARQIEGNDKAIEFEIVSYLANYREEVTVLGREVEEKRLTD
ncbi:MAG: hypothetical protein ACYSTN_07200 [Planctomycetota bacterium]|jgi:hypothetical protein